MVTIRTSREIVEETAKYVDAENIEMYDEETANKKWVPLEEYEELHINS